MLRGLKLNEHGVIFVTVIIIIMIAMVLTVTILGYNISQVTSAENELKYVQSQVLSEGAIARMLVSQFTGADITGAPVSNTITYSETLGSTTYSIVANIYPGAGPVGSNSVPFDIDVSF